ncbi:hypothetical protein P5V15_007289 [Pogonomyrmex californicus]
MHLSPLIDDFNKSMRFMHLPKQNGAVVMKYILCRTKIVNSKSQLDHFAKNFKYSRCQRTIYILLTVLDLDGRREFKENHRRSVYIKSVRTSINRLDQRQQRSITSTITSDALAKCIFCN